MSSKHVFSDELTGVRGLAAIIVIVFHALLIFQVKGVDNGLHLPVDVQGGWSALTQLLIALFNGSAAVVLFFVLSGTVLSLSLARTTSLAWRELSAFYIRRAFRIFPLLVAFTLVTALMHHIYFDVVYFSVTTDWMDKYYKIDPGFGQVFRNAIGLSNKLNSPSWTIRIEIAASVIFPLLYLLSTGRLFVVSLGGLVLLVLMFIPGVSISHTETYLLAFYLGALIPRFAEPLVQIFFRLTSNIRIALYVTILIIGAIVGRLLTPSAFNDPKSALVQILCATFIVAILYHGPQNKLLRSTTLVFLGQISYGLYLIHFLVLFTLAHAIAPRISSLTPAEALLLNMGLAATTIALTVPIATVAYYYLEKPCQKFGYKLASTVFISISQTLRKTQA